jgi:predicted ATPase
LTSIPRTIHAKRRQRVAGKVLTLDRALEDTLPYLFALLGLGEGEHPLAQLEAQLRRRRTMEAIKRLLLRESVNQPLLLICEDLHWVDAETQALLDLLAGALGTAKILLLVSYRPEYTHRRGKKTYYTQERLDPLGRESAAEMLAVLLGGGADLEPLRQRIIEQTQGNPFFMEEIVQSLFEQGVLVREESRAGTRSPRSNGRCRPIPTNSCSGQRISGDAANCGSHRGRRGSPRRTSARRSRWRTAWARMPCSCARP